MPTAQLARELGCDRSELLDFRHRLQDGPRRPPAEPLTTRVLEADEVYQNAGKKGVPHRDPDDPPRRRANKRPGHGTLGATTGRRSAAWWARQSGQVRLTVDEHSDGDA